MLDVLQEYVVASLAVELLEERLRADPSFLTSRKLRRRLAFKVRYHLEFTYLIRLFAEFEAALRDVWRNAWKRPTEPPMKDLIDVFATKRLISRALADDVHRVRDYRNHLVHQGRAAIDPIPIHDAQALLSRFLSRLPNHW